MPRAAPCHLCQASLASNGSSATGGSSCLPTPHQRGGYGTGASGSSQAMPLGGGYGTRGAPYPRARFRVRNGP
eukprot:scaffold7008_cov47-Prasinocladus_malaysianus.AAC.2